jgi:hypothetical protein
MLPLVASAAMGILGQNAAKGDMGSTGGDSPLDGLSGLSSFLDADGDGSVTDDLLEMATKSFFK